ncbi:MAG: OsmC family protein [Bacillota bacterium]|nr:OsmC family protein [Bacillota bacterium]NLU54153.1 OsmC family protein [Bacillota bacterium]HOA90412.1 OsmC family protein [Bacillota bacterium]HOJ46454.1 OsmC family protein [Bacillota bacterium]HOL13112.1 OsmC family protein [Bacillota bacterium]
MQINVRWNGKRQFIGECPSGHELLLDSSPEVGGENAGPRPTEALLTALGGCTGIDVIMILEKMQQKVTAYHMEITGERNATEPKYFTDIHIKYVITGENLSEDRVKRAIDLSYSKYCSIIHSLKANITTSYEIIEAK